jgi:hypothetical protein
MSTTADEALEGPAIEGPFEPAADPTAVGLARVRKAVATVAAAAIGVGIALGIDVAEPVKLAAATILTITPIAVYAFRNGSITAKKANKAIIALGAGVVGVAAFFGVDVAEPVAQTVGVLLAVTPLLVFVQAND